MIYQLLAMVIQMCERDGCDCGFPAKTINDIAKELAELTPPTELETN
jgi:hypothetical protein